MSKGVKIFLWIIVIVAVLAFIGSMYAYRSWQKISFKFSFQGIKFENIDLPQVLATLLAGGTITGSVGVGCTITNNNSFSIPFSNLKAKLFFNGIQIGETSDVLYGQKITVPQNSQFSFSDNASIYINKNALSIIQDLIAKKSPTIDYEVRIKIFGIQFPFPIKNNFQLSI